MKKNGNKRPEWVLLSRQGNHSLYEVIYGDGSSEIIETVFLPEFGEEIILES